MSLADYSEADRAHIVRMLNSFVGVRTGKFDFLIRVFGKLCKMHMSNQGGNIRFEIFTRSRPRNKGVLELQKEKGFYSIVTAYQMDWPD